MFDKLEEVRARYQDLNAQLADPELTSDPDRYQKLAKEHAHLEDLVEAYEEYKEVEAQIEENELLKQDDDDEIREMARDELEELEQRHQELQERIKQLLIPKDPLDEKNILLEIRAGTGGDEAALFAADLFRMYNRYAENHGWDIDIVDTNITDQGGYKEIIALIEGDEVYSHLKYEAGVHRVQRVPETETKGRIHTSAVTVAVLPEAEDVEVNINPSDLNIDTYRSGGPGGQHANMTDSAVRITHAPSGVVVSCQDEASQHKNKAKAMRVLKARLLEREREEQRKSRREDRREQVGTGDRSERIRTYNFPQTRITDHRIDFTTHQMEKILDGDVDRLIEPLQTHFQAEKLKDLDL
jgi:peptide chain release factor 1